MKNKYCIRALRELTPYADLLLKGQITEAEIQQADIETPIKTALLYPSPAAARAALIECGGCSLPEARGIVRQEHWGFKVFLVALLVPFVWVGSMLLSLGS